MKKGSFLVGVVGGALIALVISLVGYSIFHWRSNSYGEHIAFAMSDLPLLSQVSLSYLKDCPDDTLDLPEGESIMGRLMVFYGSENRELADTLIECGHSMEQPDTYGLRPLHSAVLSENEAAVRYLVAKGADFNAPISSAGDEYAGQTPLEFAKSLRIQAEDKTKLDGIVLYLGQVGSE